MHFGCHLPCKHMAVLKYNISVAITSCNHNHSTSILFYSLLGLQKVIFVLFLPFVHLDHCELCIEHFFKFSKFSYILVTFFSVSYCFCYLPAFGFVLFCIVAYLYFSSNFCFCSTANACFSLCFRYRAQSTTQT